MTQEEAGGPTYHRIEYAGAKLNANTLQKDDAWFAEAAVSELQDRRDE
jgi:hypothetical protein